MITDNYIKIKMCEQAEEIQKDWKPKAGDYVQLNKNKQIYLVSSVEKSKDKKKVVFYTNIINGNDSWCYLEFFKDNFVYLPTQEQLQEMSGIPWWRFDKRCDGVRCCLLEDPLNNIEIRTKEEAGICVVMEKKYNKIWTGEKWEEVKTSE